MVSRERAVSLRCDKALLGDGSLHRLDLSQRCGWLPLHCKDEFKASCSYECAHETRISKYSSKQSSARPPRASKRASPGRPPDAKETAIAYLGAALLFTSLAVLELVGDR